MNLLSFLIKMKMFYIKSVVHESFHSLWNVSFMGYSFEVEVVFPEKEILKVLYYKWNIKKKGAHQCVKSVFRELVKMFFVRSSRATFMKMGMFLCEFYVCEEYLSWTYSLKVNIFFVKSICCEFLFSKWRCSCEK